MHRLCRSLILIGIVILFAGCGGGGGSKDDGNIDPGTSIIGVWEPISATENGASVKVYEVMPETNIEARRWEMEFRQNATCQFRAYDQNGSMIEAIDGTWSSDNQIAPVILDGDTTTITWSDFGDMMTANYQLDGKPVVAKWARIVPDPTDYEPAWVGKWQAQSVQVNGVAKSLSDYFGWSAGSTFETLELQHGGNAVFKELSGDTVVKSHNEVWATGMNRFFFKNSGITYWGYWEGQVLVYVFLDPQTGDTVKLTWSAVL